MDTDALLREDRGFGYRFASVFWTVLVVAGVGLLLAQLLYVYRVQLAITVPAMRPTLERLCEAAHCQLPWSRRIDKIVIMSSSLQSDAKPGKADTQGAMTLRFTLRNELDLPQEWPTLVLDLTDFSGTLVARKNLPPEAYLSEDVRDRPFAPMSEVTAGVPISLEGMQVNGYKLDKYFP